MNRHDVLLKVSNPERFLAGQFVVTFQKPKRNKINQNRFQRACLALDDYLDGLFEKDSDEYLKRQSDALIGEPSAVNYFTDKVKTFLRDRSEFQGIDYPAPYESAEEALFHTVLGFGPMQAWFKNPTEGAVINGTSILFDQNGRKVLQPFSFASIDQVRRLIRALELRDPTTKHSIMNPAVSIEMLNGTRVQILDKPLVKEPYITFRQYTIKDFSFQNISRKKTIPQNSIRWFHLLSRLRMNIVASGPVKSGKTTLLKVIFGARDPDLTVVSLETDQYEIRLAHDFPEREPYVSEIRASLEEMKYIFPVLLRLDPHYIMIPEVRSSELELALLAAERGKGFLMTYHSSNIIDIPHEFANITLNEYPRRSWEAEYRRAANLIDLVVSIYEVEQGPDRGRKIIEGVYAFDYDRDKDELNVVPWMKYDNETDSWGFSEDIPSRLSTKLRRYDTELFEEFLRESQKLSAQNPIHSGRTVTKVKEWLS